MEAILDKLLLDSGVPEDARRYIKEGQGLTSTALLARSAPNLEKFEENIIKPLLDGNFKHGEQEFKTKAQPALVRSSLAVAWEDATVLRARAVSAVSTVHSDTAVAQKPATLQTSKHTLNPGDWQKQVDLYEAKWSPKRTFPQTVLVGAEEVLARLLHESRASQEFTPITLGEILQKRAWTAEGEVNPHKKKKSTVQPLCFDHQGGIGVGTPVDDWAPHSQWALQDAFQAIKWAYVWADYCDDEVADEFLGIFTRHLRSSGGAMVKQLYETVAWKVCMNMRAGKSFTAAVQELIADVPWMTATVNRLLEPSANNGGGRRNEGDKGRGHRGDDQYRGKNGKGKGKGKDGQRGKSQGRGRGRSRSPDRRTGGGKGQNQKGRGRGLCRDFQVGRCRNPCRNGYTHACEKCGMTNHGRNNCWN